MQGVLGVPSLQYLLADTIIRNKIKNKNQLSEQESFDCSLDWEGSREGKEDAEDGSWGKENEEIRYGSAGGDGGEKEEKGVPGIGAWRRE